jgi:plasmid maintenance system antidote protein VapI
MKITQKSISESLNLSQSMISALINGKRGLGYKNAKRVSRVCRCDPAIFLERDAEAIVTVFGRCFGYRSK